MFLHTHIMFQYDVFYRLKESVYSSDHVRPLFKNLQWFPVVW